jgi:hypothetical protein
MLFQHRPWVVGPFALPNSPKPGPLSRQIQTADTGKQGQMRHFYHLALLFFQIISD